MFDPGGQHHVATRTLLKGGHLVTMDPQRGELHGDILLEDTRIIDVGEGLVDRNAAVVELRDAVVIPGLIDTHVHLWQAPVRGLAAGCWGREYFGVVHPLSGRLRPTDMYAATYGGALEMLSHGVTTVFDFCHATNSPDHATASLRGLADSGIRGVFGFCFRHRPEAMIEGFETLEQRKTVLHELNDAWRDHDRIRLGVALNNIDHVSLGVHAQELAAAREGGLVSAIHSNLGGQVSASHDAGLLDNDILWVHAGEITDAELDLLAQLGGSIVSTPQIEASAMAVTPVTNRAVRHGVPVTFGTDVPAMINGDMMGQLRVAQVLARLHDGQSQRQRGKAGTREDDIPLLDTADLLRMATLGSAEVLQIADQIGSLTPGKKADVVVLSTSPLGLGAATPTDHAVLQSTSRDVERVYVSGRLVVENGVPVGADMRAVRADLDAARDWMLGHDPLSPWGEIDDVTRSKYQAGQGKV